MAIFTMLIGLPGSGKSHYANEYIKTDSGTVIISSDAIREELYGDANNQSNPVKVFSIMEERTIAALSAGEDVVYDATNIHSRSRHTLVNRLKHKFPDLYCVCVIVLCSIKDCKRRQGLRDRKVPEEVIERMAREFQVPYFHEGWDFIALHHNGSRYEISREQTCLMFTPHDNPHHTTGSIGAHCCKALDAMTAKLTELEEDEFTRRILCEAAYRHDIGKRQAKVFHDSKGNPSEIAHFYNHENLGAYMWLSGDEYVNWDDYSFLTIGLLIQLHMMAYAFPNKSREELTRWCKVRGHDDWIADWLWYLHEADLAAH
jgi:predicted kinase